MADQVNADVAGLQISNSTFSSSPPGSLRRADNCVMPQKGVIQPRNGMARLATLPSAADMPFAMTEFEGTTIVNYATSKSSTSYGLTTAGGTPFTGGPYNPVDCDGVNETYGRMKFAQAGGYLSFCTSTGPKVLESTGGQPRAAGLLQPPDPSGFAYLAAGNNWLEYGSSVRVRTVVRRETSSGVSLLSPPSGAAVITNRILIPAGMLTKAAGVATATLAGGQRSGLVVGNTFDLTPGEADFPAGSYTVASTPSASSFTFAITAGSASSTLAQDADTGPRAVLVEANLPPDAVAGDALREYRSLATTTDTPNDELFLANETYLTSGEISAGQALIEDTTPEAVLDDPLYTNPLTGEGALQANYQPPIYRDVAWWGERAWYAQTTGQQTLRLQMLGVGAPNGIQDGDTLTIDDGTDSVTFTFVNSPAASTDVQIYSNGTPSLNIQGTTANLIARFYVNAPTSWALFTEGGTLPGKLRLERTDFSADPFQVTASRPVSWTPALDASTPTLSIAEYQPNGLAYSKLGQPEAVAPVNFTRVGSKNYAIARIIALKQSLLIFKSGDGIYALTGSFPFQVQQISTANILAPDACCSFADAAWAYTDQGILRVSDAGGSTVVSRPIETELNELRARLPEETHDYAFAVPYETERRVMFYVPVDFNTGDGPDLPLLSAYCYNSATQSWTGPLHEAAFSGIASPTADKLLLGVYDYAWSTSRITIERKGSSPEYLDYADADFSATITAVNVGGDPLVITLSSTNDVEAGDGIVQFANRSKIRSVSGNNVTLHEEAPFTAGLICSVYKHYEVRLQFLPTGNPASRKVLTRLAWVFMPDWFSALASKTTLMTDQVQADLELSTPFDGFGFGGFGEAPFGDAPPLVVDVNPIDAKWTNAAQFYPGFLLSEAWPKFKLQGFVMKLDTAEAPVGRGR